MVAAGRTQISYKAGVAENDKMTERGVLNKVKRMLDALSVDVSAGITVAVAREKLVESYNDIKDKRFSKLENSGGYVVMVQRLLNKAKADGIVDFGNDLVLDSIIGDNMEGAIKAFQIAFNKFLPAGTRMAEDGLIGPKTIKALLIVSGHYFNTFSSEDIARDFDSEPLWPESVQSGDEIDSEYDNDKRFIESLDQNIIGDRVRDILNLTPQNGPIVLPDTMNSMEAAMALWKVWSHTLNPTMFNNFMGEYFDITKVTTWSKLPKMYVSKSLKEIILKQLKPYLDRLFSWEEDSEISPTKFYDSLEVVEEDGIEQESQ